MTAEALAKYKTEWNRRARARFREKGLCRCGHKRVRGRLQCRACLDSDAKRRILCVLAGVCPNCKQRKAARGRTTCGVCRERSNRERREAMALYRAVYPRKQ